MTLEEVFLHLVDVDSFTLERQHPSTGLRLVQCTNCQLRGVIDEKAGSHSCKLEDGSWGASERVVERS
jgi:hypothetical protein